MRLRSSAATRNASPGPWTTTRYGARALPSTIGIPTKPSQPAIPISTGASGVDSAIVEASPLLDEIDELDLSIRKDESVAMSKRDSLQVGMHEVEVVGSQCTEYAIPGDHVGEVRHAPALCGSHRARLSCC